MPYLVADLVVDRIDFVDEGANTGAFIEVFKRKEKKQSMDFSEIVSKLKPEHAEVIQQHVDALNSDLSKARDDLAAADERNAELSDELGKANDELSKAKDEIDVLKAKDDSCECDGTPDENGICSVCGKTKKNASFDEAEVLKAMPESLREQFIKMREQKEAAEEQVRKAAEEKREAEAIAKAATLKALPVDQGTLVQILKSCDESVVEVLTAAAAAVEGTVLTEVGKAGGGRTTTDAWDKIEEEAEKVAARDSITKQKAIGVVIKENPELYKEYLDGGIK